MKVKLNKLLFNKKIFSLIMVASILIGMLPTSASALAAGLQIKAGSIGADGETNLPSSLGNGQIWTDKSVIPDSSNPGEFTIKLRATGQDYKISIPGERQKLDVVLVLDVSKSMNDKPAGQTKTKLEAMEDAAKAAVSSLLSVSGNRVAIVSYSDSATRKTGSNNSSAFLTNANTLNSAISGLSADGYTNIQNAFLIAQQIIAARTVNNNKPVIILMSDGEPTVYHTSLTNHTDSNRTRNMSSGSNFVWWTIQQAMKAKNEISDLRIYTIGFGVGSNAYAVATLMPTAANTAPYRPAQTTFNHKYWEEGSSITSNGAQDLFDTFTRIIDTLISSKPTSVTNEGIHTGIAIEDFIGEGFEVVEPLPDGLTQVGNKITWTIGGDEFKTMPYDSTSLDTNKIHEKTFKVRISDNATVAKEYKTNASAHAKFNVSGDNPYYNEIGDVTVQLTNKGWLTLEPIPPMQAVVKINKVVNGPISGEHTFTFDIYGPNRTKLNDSDITITVDESNKSRSVEVPVELPYNMYVNGKATLSVEERVPTPMPVHWTYDMVKTVVFTQGNINEMKKVTFINTYAPKGTLTVTKLWGESEPASDITFELQKKVSENNWVKVGESSYIIPKGSTTGVSISDLELGVEYRVVETSIADFNTEYSPEYVVFTPDNLNKTITITNTYQQPVYEITVNKVWDDNDNEAGDRPTSIQFKVFDSTGTQKDTLEIQPDANGNWSGVFETTVADTYTFEEIVPKDYVVDAETKNAVVTNGDRTESITFTNRYVVPTATLEIIKVWEGENGDRRFRPDDITVNVYKDNAEEPFASVTLEASEGWKKKLTELDFGTYSVEEVSVSDYTTGYTSNPVTLVKDGERNGTIVITNYFSNPTGEITVNKTWADRGVSIDEIRPNSITITLTNVAIEPLTAVLSDDNGWTYTFNGLPLSGTYTVTESDDSGKLVNYRLSGNTSVVLDNINRKGTLNLTNTYAKGTITVTKEWVDLNNPEADLPANATITLKKRVEGTENTTGDGIFVVDTVTLTRGSFSHTFYDLELSDGEKVVTYFVEEYGILFYTTSIDNEFVVLDNDNPNGAFTVTNTYTDPKGSLTVYKEWNHGNNPSDKQPDSVTVKLYKNGVFLTEAAFTGSHTFVDLELGAEYTIVEAAVDNYSTGFSGSESYTPSKVNGSVPEGSITITNTYIPETGAIKVSKVWEDDGPIADEITVSLRRSYGENSDSGWVRTLTLNDENGWTDTVTGLELYGPGGVPYRYSAIEQAFENSVLYRVENLTTPTLIKGETAEITIRNIYTPEKGTLIISKVWEGEDYTPDEIEVRLIVNGKPEETTMVLNNENSWTVELNNLNVNNTYSVEEVDPAEEYEVSYSSDNITFSTENLEQEIVITNTRTEDMPELELIKTTNTPSIVLSGGTGTFSYQLEIKNTGNRTLRNVSVVDEMDLDGVNYVYSEGWTKLEDGVFERYVADTMAPGAVKHISYTVTVNRAGTYNNTATATGYYMGSYYEPPVAYRESSFSVMAEEYDPELGYPVTASDSAIAIARIPDTVPSDNPPTSQGTVRVQFVDEDGGVLSTGYELSGSVGTSYQTAARDIPSYTLTAVPANATGTFINGTVTVVYVYKTAVDEPEEEEFENEVIPEGTPEEPILDEEVPQDGDILPQTGLPIVTVPQLFGGSLIALGLYFGRKSKKEEEE